MSVSFFLRFTAEESEPPISGAADGTEVSIDSLPGASVRPPTMNPQQFLSSNKSNDDSSVNIGLIVGVVIIIVVVLGVATFCIVKSRQAQKLGMGKEVPTPAEQGADSAASASTTTEVL